MYIYIYIYLDVDSSSGDPSSLHTMITIVYIQRETYAKNTFLSRCFFFFLFLNFIKCFIIIFTRIRIIVLIFLTILCCHWSLFECKDDWSTETEYENVFSGRDRGEVCFLKQIEKKWFKFIKYKPLVLLFFFKQLIELKLKLKQ